MESGGIQGGRCRRYGEERWGQEGGVTEGVLFGRL